MSADLFGRGRSLLPYAHCKNIEAWWWKTNPPPQQKTKNKNKKKKKKKNVLDHYLHHNLVMLLPLWCFLLIYSSQKVPTSLNFYSALHILVLHMHRKFDVDSIDSFWDMEEQSTRRKERKKEERTRKLHLQANVTKKVIILHNPIL